MAILFMLCLISSIVYIERCIMTLVEGHAHISNGKNYKDTSLLFRKIFFWITCVSWTIFYYLNQ